MVVAQKKKSYQHLHDDLKRQIIERQLLPGMALPSENTIAADYGVSRPTVRKALEMLEGTSYIVRRAGVGSFVCDLENAGSKKRQRQLTIGTDLFVGDAGFYTGMILEGVKRGCEDSGSRLTLINKNDLVAGFASVDGLVLAATMPDDFSYYSDMAESGMPVALINRFPAQPELAFFSVDYVAEAERAVEYLLLLGHRDIAVIGSDFDGSVATGARTRGWEQAFIKRGLIPPLHLCFPFSEMRGGNEKLTEFFKNNRITAAFVTLGALISSVAQAVGRAGLRVPDNISLMCFDDLEEMLELLGLPISYVKMPLNLMGRHAVEYLVKRNNDSSYPAPRKIFEASLVINSGCRAIAKQ